MIRSILTVIVLMACVAFLSCPRNQPPDRPTAPVGPGAGLIDSTSSFSTTATDPNGDSVCLRLDWGNGDVSDWSGYVRSGDTVTLSHAWDSVGNYAVTAQARDIHEALSDWSEAAVIAIDSLNLPPDRPGVPSGCSSGHTGVAYEYTAFATDPEKDSVALQFSWGDGDTSGWSCFDTSGALVSMSHVWTVVGSLHVVVRARDQAGSLSEWSLGRSVVMFSGNTGPNKPELLDGPDDGLVDSTYRYLATTTDPETDRVAYRFDWGDGDTTEWSDYTASGALAVFYHAWDSVGRYLVRVQAKDDLGAESDWSDSLLMAIYPTYPNRVVATIPVGQAPWGIAVLPNGEYVYVANERSDDVSVIRTSDNVEVARVQVGGTPFYLAALPSSEYVYVSNSYSDDVSVIRTSDNTVVTAIPVGDWPAGVAALPDGKRVYVANADDNTVSVIRTEDNVVTAVIPVGEQPEPMIALPNGEYVYVGCSWDEAVSVISTADDSMVASIPIDAPAYGLTATPDGDYVYVAACHNDDVPVIRTSDNTIVARIQMEDVGPYALTALPNGEYVYVTSFGPPVVLVIRTADIVVADTIQVVSLSTGADVLPGGARVYATHPDVDSVSVIGH